MSSPLKFAHLAAALMTAAILTQTSEARAQQAPAPVLAPPAAGRVQRLTLSDGSQLVGRIVSVDSASVQFESGLGTTTIPRASIVSVREEEPGIVRQGQYYFPNPNATRLIFAPTGRMLKAGEGYFSDFWIFFPGFAAGLSNNFTFGGGMSILPGVGVGEQIFYATPKLGIVQSEQFNAAVGALAMIVPDFDSGSESAGLLYGVGTWGAPDASFTAGLAYGYVGSDLAETPVVMFGGEIRASPRVGLVTENYILPGGSFMPSGALRFMGQDITVDLGLARFTDGEDGATFPVLNFMWKW